MFLKLFGKVIKNRILPVIGKALYNCIAFAFIIVFIKN